MTYHPPPIRIHLPPNHDLAHANDRLESLQPSQEAEVEQKLY